MLWCKARLLVVSDAVDGEFCMFLECKAFLKAIKSHEPVMVKQVG